jgi:hypothetical protein
MFYYEHIGHMQFSTLTLHSLRILDELTGGGAKVFIPWVEARNAIQKCGFSWKQADGELERFCYGFECIDSFNRAGVHQIALTSLGRNFIDQLLVEDPYQYSQLACILRPARKRGYWNVIVQESTFFNRAIYSLIKEYSFRSGPARDFLKCMSTTSLVEFIVSAIDLLSLPRTIKQNPTLSECIRVVEECGKYWASVGGKYSWYVFGQEYTLPFVARDWQLYDSLVKVLIRPPEWGGGREIAYTTLMNILAGEENLLKFREAGIIRPCWIDFNIRNAKFRLTAPGYLMWERKSKGFCYEFRYRRETEEIFSMGLCKATDLPNHVSEDGAEYGKTKGIPSMTWRGAKGALVNRFLRIIAQESVLTFL